MFLQGAWHIGVCVSSAGGWGQKPSHTGSHPTACVCSAIVSHLALQLWEPLGPSASSISSLSPSQIVLASLFLFPPFPVTLQQMTWAFTGQLNRGLLASWRLPRVFPKPLHSFQSDAALSFSGWLSSQPFFMRGLSCHDAALSSLVTLAKSNYFLCVLVSTSTKWNNIICYTEISGFMRSFGKYSKVLYKCLQFFIMLNILRMQYNQD